MKIVVAVTLLLLSTLCYGAQYLDDPAFTEKSDYGMSRARSPTYDYQFDPEVYWGYNRQDNIDNGTAIGASGNYLVTQDTLYFRVDNRDCKQNKASKPKTCICYPSASVTAENPVCDGKVMAHICQREVANTDSAQYTKSDGSTSAPMVLKDDEKNGEVVEGGIVESVHVTFKAEGAFVTGTNYLGGGLHMANTRDYVNKGKFFFGTEADQAASPKFEQMYPLNKNFQVITLNIYFPESDGNCARLDFYGLAYADQFLFAAPTIYKGYDAPVLDVPKDKDCKFCNGRCAAVKT